MKNRMICIISLLIFLYLVIYKCIEKKRPHHRQYGQRYGRLIFRIFLIQTYEIKDVHWYLMRSNSYLSRPQREEFFVDSGYYKYHEAYHLLKFPNEKDILEKAYNEYLELKSAKLWTNRNF